jgi:hypothetical protein
VGNSKTGASAWQAGSTAQPRGQEDRTAAKERLQQFSQEKLRRLTERLPSPLSIYTVRSRSRYKPSCIFF